MVAPSVFFPKPPSPDSPQESLVHSAPHFASDLCLWLSHSVINLVTLNSAVRLQHQNQGRVCLGSGVVVSPQAVATQRGVVCLSKMAPAVWGVTQHQDPGSCSVSSLPKATILSVSSSISSPLCSPLCQSPGSVSYTHLTLPTILRRCRSRWSPYH